MGVLNPNASLDLSSRKLSVLAAVVDEFLRTGEPVGSKAVTALLSMQVSSATVRNDMAALEKLGLIEQPYTSAGRVPSYLGYRVYIERLMRPKPLTDREKRRVDEQLLRAANTPEEIVDTAAEALANLTGCAAVSTSVAPEFSVITHVEVVPAGHRVYALLLITSNGDVKNKLCRLEFDLPDELLRFFETFINQNLNGVVASRLNPAYMQKLSLALGSYMMTLSPLLYAVYELTGELQNRNIHLKGEANLLSYKDVDATEIVRFLSTKNSSLAALLEHTFSGIHVLFGQEQDNFVLTNGSLIVSPYGDGHSLGGALGLIGPIRLDYAKIIPYVEYFSDKVTGILSNLTQDYEEGEQQNGKDKRG